MSKYTNSYIRMDMDWDTHDAWGSVQSALFDLCDAWFMATEAELPGYEPSVWFLEGDFEGASDRARMWSGFMAQGDITILQVTYWVTVLERMQGLVKLAGREY